MELWENLVRALRVHNEHHVPDGVFVQVQSDDVKSTLMLIPPRPPHPAPYKHPQGPARVFST